MQLRKTLGAAALVATAVMASVAGCSGRDDGDNEPTPDAGCSGACGQDAGTDAGSDAGSRVCPPAQNGLGPIGNIKANGKRGDIIDLDNVVVTAVKDFDKGDQGDFIARFWVVDPCFPMEGIYVDKFYKDKASAAAPDFQPAVGDVVRIKGWFRRFNANGRDGAPELREAYRPVIKSTYLLNVSGVTVGDMIVAKKETDRQILPDNEVAAGFGNADSGKEKPNADFAGLRVHIPGPLSVTNVRPPSMKSQPDNPTNTTYLGIEVTGGILVSTSKTYRSDNCKIMETVDDGGTVTFPKGIRGVWETFTNVQCSDAGTTTTLPDGGTSTRCNAYGDGVVPGTTNNFTYVLHPMDCDTDLAPAP
ncbi:hypothetical protein [Myxococcus landrumensis]|uniref:Lipoprotein n=1 Tax=Myxococcus landrumensis TaxID=2813577 RepID=A0ABX7NGD4_9BACT|nr:hypothetical protein [Myxococcus landrumus]QSQ16627.1 hypothetical protein JY572_11515 [Myxococcus landrumus]